MGKLKIIDKTKPTMREIQKLQQIQHVVSLPKNLDLL